MRPVLAAAVLLWCLAPAQAQDAADAVLRASRALQDAPGARVTFRLTGQGPGRFAETLPALDGQARWSNDPERRALRVTGAGKARASDESPTPFDAAYADDRVTFVDHPRQQVVARPASGRPDTRLATLNDLEIAVLASDPPLGHLLDGAELALDAPQAVAEEPCTVIVATLPETRPDGSTRRYLTERWFLADSDGLPRRVERVADFPMVGKFIMTLELSAWTLADVPETELAIEPPEGYRFIDPNARTPRATTRPDSPHAVEQGERPGQNQPPALPAYPPAPPFRLTRDDGVELTNDTQRGRVTLVYFWGSWCLNCREYSLVVDELSERFGPRGLDLLAPAVMEADRDAARDAARSHRFAPVWGGDASIADFRVRVYPTLVVIGPDNTVRATEFPRPEVEPDVARDELARAIEAALAEIDPPAP